MKTKNFALVMAALAAFFSTPSQSFVNVASPAAAYTISPTAAGFKLISMPIDAAIVDGMARTYTAQAAGAVGVRTPFRMKFGLAAEAVFGLTKTMTAMDVVAFGARGLGAVAGASILLPLAATLYDQFRCRQKAGDLTLAQCDSGIPQAVQTQTVYCGALPYGGLAKSCATTRDILANVFVGQIPGTNWGYNANYYATTAELRGYSSTGAPIIHITIKNAGDNKPVGAIYSEFDFAVDPVAQTKTLLSCPPGANKSDKSPDGKCRMDDGAGYVDVPWPDAIKQVGGGLAPVIGDPSQPIPKLKDVVEEGVKAGIDASKNVQPANAAGFSDGPVSVDEPAKISTKTNPDGTTETTTEQTRHDFGYAEFSPDVVNTETKLKTVVSPKGNTVEKTVTNEPVDIPADTSKTDCQLFPDIIGCQLQGAIPNSPTIPNLDIPVTLSSVPFLTSTGCPEPVSFSINLKAFSKTFQISYQPLCDVMVKMNSVFTAIFAASAAFIFLQGIKDL